MAFYETEPAAPVIFPALALNGYYLIRSGQTAAFPFTLPPAGLITVNVIQQIGTQDFTLRAWISATANGGSVAQPPNLAFWHPNHIPDTIVSIYDIAAPPPLSTRPLPLPPGNYFLNVQNLENRDNVFYSLLTVFSSDVSVFG